MTTIAELQQYADAAGWENEDLVFSLMTREQMVEEANRLLPLAGFDADRLLPLTFDACTTESLEEIILPTLKRKAEAAE